MVRRTVVLMLVVAERRWRLWTEGKPVHVDAVLARPGYEPQEHRVPASRPGHVGGHRSPALPAAGIADRKTADRHIDTSTICSATPSIGS